MIAIIDYGAGNLTSVKKAFDFLRAESLREESIVTFDPDVVACSNKIVLPGVGHFASTAALSDSGMRPAAFRSSEYVSACSGCFRAARKLRKSKV